MISIRSSGGRPISAADGAMKRINGCGRRLEPVRSCVAMSSFYDGHQMIWDLIDASILIEAVFATTGSNSMKNLLQGALNQTTHKDCLIMTNCLQMMRAFHRSTKINVQLEDLLIAVSR